MRCGEKSNRDLIRKRRGNDAVKWPQLLGKLRQQPATGCWHDWKPIIANECGAQCIYCAIHEGRFGGIRNFHVEHFRPKTRFLPLENDIRNLYLACAICNVLKCDDWPGEPSADHSVIGYPDPAICDYNTVFDIDRSTCEIGSRTVAGRYVIERIMLNRAQLILQRRLAALLDRIGAFVSWCNNDLQGASNADLKEIIHVLAKINKLKSVVLNARPYEDEDARRPPKAKKKRLRS